MHLLPEAPSAGASNEPLYNIGVVTRMTGISMATLRAWERRYDFPEASRTTGGHRLYSEHDILRLRWVKARIEDGMQTAQAILALRHQEEVGESVAKPAAPPPAKEREPVFDHSAIAAYQQKLYHALIDRDLQTAEMVLSEALAVASPDDQILHIIGPAIAQIGEAWERNEISIAVEHLATNFLRQRLLLWMVSGPPALPVKPVVLACAPNEWHEGSLLMLGALLRRKRYPVAYLGQSVPLRDLASFVEDIDPAAVVIVAMSEDSASALVEWQQWLPEAARTGKPVISFGGRIFTQEPGWQQKIAGVFLGSTIQEGLETLERLVKD